MISACKRTVRIALGGRNALDQLLEQFRDALAGLGADQRGVVGRDADDFLDFVNDLGRIGRRQVDLVDDREHLEPLFERGVAVGDALRLDALAGIDHQQRTLAGRERPRYLVGKIHVARAYR